MHNKIEQYTLEGKVYYAYTSRSYQRHGCFVYMVNDEEPGIDRFCEKTQELIHITDTAAEYLDVNDKGLFYLDAKDHRFYRCDHDGANICCLQVGFDKPVGTLPLKEFYLVDERIYFFDAELHLCWCPVEGGKAKVISTEQMSFIQIRNGEIYYEVKLPKNTQDFCPNDKLKLKYLMDLDGNNITQIEEDDTLICW